MATIRPSDLPTVVNANPSASYIQDDGSAVVQVTPVQIVDAAVPLASQAEAEAGTVNNKRMSPLRTAQAILFQTSALSSGLASVTSALAGKQDVVIIGSNRLLGRYSAGPGAPQEITLGPNMTLSGTGVLDSTGGGGGGGATAAFVTPQQYGAVGNGTTDDRDALLNAIQSGNIVDGGGKTYAISAPLTPSSIVGIRNCRLKWASTSAMSAQQFQLNIIDKSNFFVQNCWFDLGTVEDTGSTGDSSRGGLRITTSNPNVTFNDNVVVDGNYCFGAGNGTGLFIRSCNFPIVCNNTVTTRYVTVPSGHAQDCQNGIDVSQCKEVKVYGNTVRNLRSRETSGGSLAHRWSRGMVFVELTGFTVTGNVVADCDQNYDFSGGIVSGTFPNGNTNGTITGNFSGRCRTWGMKFANVARDLVITGNSITGFGLGGIVVSPAGSDVGDKSTRRLLIADNYLTDPSDLDGRTNIIGIWITFRQYGDPPSGPWFGASGCKVNNNVISDTTGGNRLLYGIVQSDGDRNVIADLPYNEVKGNKISGQTGAATRGCFPADTCIVSRDTSNQSIPNAANTDDWTTATWNGEVVDGQGWHSNSSNPERVTVTETGWYALFTTVTFSTSSAGYRVGRFVVNGGTFPGNEFTATPQAGDVTIMQGHVPMVYLTAGQNVRVELRQNSGSSVNMLAGRSRFTVRRIQE